MAPRIIATDKEIGKVVWDTSFSDTPDVTFTAAPLTIEDKITAGAANGEVRRSAVTFVSTVQWA